MRQLEDNLKTSNDKYRLGKENKALSILKEDLGWFYSYARELSCTRLDIEALTGQDDNIIEEEDEMGRVSL